VPEPRITRSYEFEAMVVGSFGSGVPPESSERERAAAKAAFPGSHQAKRGRGDAARGAAGVGS
jgi:hypothetical protein